MRGLDAPRPQSSGLLPMNLHSTTRIRFLGVAAYEM